jgi:hypothetical protein
MISPDAQLPTEAGAQRLLYGVNVRQTCPCGHSASALLQRQRPLVFDGVLEHEFVDATLSHVKPVAHLSPHPPQLCSSDEISTHEPEQHREPPDVPHDAPSARFVATQ